MGLLPVECVIDIRHFVYLHHILMLTNDEAVKNLYYQQLELLIEEIWQTKYIIKQYNIIVEEGYVKSLSREKYKTYITYITYY